MDTCCKPNRSRAHVLGQQVFFFFLSTGRKLNSSYTIMSESGMREGFLEVGLYCKPNVGNGPHPAARVERMIAARACCPVT